MENLINQVITSESAVLTTWKEAVARVVSQRNTLDDAIQQHNYEIATMFQAFVNVVRAAVIAQDVNLLSNAFPALESLPGSYQRRIKEASGQAGKITKVVKFSSNGLTGYPKNWKKHQNSMLDILDSLVNPFKPLGLGEEKAQKAKVEKSIVEQGDAALKRGHSVFSKLAEIGWISEVDIEILDSILKAKVSKHREACLTQNEIGAGEPPSANVKSA